jgi:Mg-chelatase subunit ChlD
MEPEIVLPAPDGAAAAHDRQAEIFETLATTAEAIAETEDESAEVHERAAANLPGATEHVARARRVADAERAAASAYRRHEVPPEDVRQVIRESRASADDQ